MKRIVFDAPVFGKEVGASEEVSDHLADTLCKAEAAHLAGDKPKAKPPKEPPPKAEPRGKETVTPIRTHEQKHPNRED